MFGASAFFANGSGGSVCSMVLSFYLLWGVSLRITL
jgi:hypothetical protein